MPEILRFTSFAQNDKKRCFYSSIIVGASNARTPCNNTNSQHRFYAPYNLALLARFVPIPTTKKDYKRSLFYYILSIAIAYEMIEDDSGSVGVSPSSPATSPTHEPMF